MRMQAFPFATTGGTGMLPADRRPQVPFSREPLGKVEETHNRAPGTGTDAPACTKVLA